MINVKFLHDCLLVKDILVIGDLHIGYDDQFHGRAVFPGSQLENIKEKLKEVFEYLETKKLKVRKVVLLGDVKHDFSKITDIEWRETINFFDFLNENIVDKNKIIVIKGNHDTILEPIVRKRNILLKDYYKIEINGKVFCFLHGDKLFKQCLDSDFLVFGHLHPAITLSDKYKNEKYKCFLKGKWKGKQVFILPSFTSVSLGYDLNNLNEKDYKDKFFVIPNNNLKSFEIIIYNNEDKKKYNFGKLKKLI